MIKNLLLLLGLMGQPADTTAIQREYIQALENASKNDSSAAKTYEIAEKLVLNTPDSILSPLSQEQIISSLRMINTTLAVVDGMKNYEGVNWAPNIEFNSQLHPDSLVESITTQIVGQGNPELFLLFYPSDDSLRKALKKKIEDAKRRIISGLPGKNNAQSDVAEFSIPVVNRNGLVNLSLLYSKRYEDVCSVGALFRFVSGGDIFSLKIYEENYFKVVSLLEHAATNKIVLDREFVKYVLNLMNMDSRTFYGFYGGSSKYLIFEKDNVESYVKALEKELGNNTGTFPKSFNSAHVMYDGKVMPTYNVRISGAYYNSFVLKGLSPKPDKQVDINIRYGGDIAVLKTYLASIERLLSKNKKEKETAEELFALLVLASEKNIPICDAFLSQYYEMTTGNISIQSRATSFVVEEDGASRGALSDNLTNSGQDFGFSIYPPSFYVTGDYHLINKELSIVISYFAPGKEKIEGIPYKTEITVSGVSYSQAKELESILKRWEDVYKNSNLNDKHKLIRDLYDELSAINKTTIDGSVSISSLLPKTMENILNSEAKQLKEDKQTKTKKGESFSNQNVRNVAIK
jgi:hypothetical protein